MKIIDNKKDYYDYLASIYGIDKQTGVCRIRQENQFQECEISI